MNIKNISVRCTVQPQFLCPQSKYVKLYMIKIWLAESTYSYMKKRHFGVTVKIISVDLYLIIHES